MSGLEGLLDWAAGLRPAEAGILLGLLVALGLAVFRWWQARREAGRRAAAERELERRFRAIAAARDGVAVLGPGETFVYANAATARLLGARTPEDLRGRGWRSLLPAEEVLRLEKEILPDLRQRKGWTGLVDVAPRDGGRRTLELSLTWLPGGGVTWMAREAGWRDEQDVATRRREARWRSLVEAAGSVIALVGPEGEVQEWNREAERLFGVRRERVLGRDFTELVSTGEERAPVASALARALEDGTRGSFETRVDGEGEERLVLWTVTPVETEADEGRSPRLVAAGQDITGRKTAEEALRRQEDLYRLLANNSSDLVALHEPGGRFEYVSPSCGPLLGFTPDELLGQDPYRLSHSDDWKRVQAALLAARTGRFHRTTVRFRRSSGEYVWFETLIRPIRDEAGDVVQLQSSSRDISERKAFEEQLEHQALHEPLTGLPNRTLFLDRLEHALARSRREGTSVAVMFMDLDRFKVINDSLGHPAGDRLLAAVARRLRACVREADTVARLGGDEFGVLLEFDIATEDAAAVAERILRQLEPPFTFAGTELFVSGSIGIAFSGPDIRTPEDLLRYADVAMFRAKDEGPGNYRIFDPALDAGATRRLETETGLRRALERDELHVYYQPLVSLEEGRIAGVEALVRWIDPERGMVGPDEFIPVAEESGLIVPIGYRVMREACRRGRAWADGREEPLVISVNLSSRQFEHPSLEEEIASIVRETGVEPADLQLEITESELLQSAGRIQSLKDLGVRIAIDDFGTGYSSLAYLRNLPVDALKIDRTFVNGIGESRADEAIVQTVITLAGALGLEVTAEGIETEEQLRRLRELGCSGGQGYFFARPDDAAATAELLVEDPRW